MDPKTIFESRLFVGDDNMSSTADYKNFILEQLDLLNNIACKQMMGEYLLYYNGKLIGGIYDNRLLVKKTDSNQKYNMQEEVPYPGAKTMYLVKDVDDRKELAMITIDTYEGLK